MCLSDYHCDAHKCGWYNVWINPIMHVYFCNHYIPNMQETKHLICCKNCKQNGFFNNSALLSYYFVTAIIFIEKSFYFICIIQRQS